MRYGASIGKPYYKQDSTKKVDTVPTKPTVNVKTDRRIFKTSIKAEEKKD